MNLKLAAVLIALSLPLTGCGNKGPLMLPQSLPPAETEPLLSLPPLDAASLPVDAVPADSTPAAPPTDDASDGKGEVLPPPPPPPASGNGNG